MSGGNGKKPAQEEGGGESAPLWIISFADMISLLMAFFVMLSTFNTFDEGEGRKLQAAVEYSMVPMGGWLQEEGGNAWIAESPEATHAEGSSKPTDDQPAKSRNINRTQTADFEKYKVFDVPSATVFVAQTAVLKPQGRDWLDMLAEYLGRIEGSVVIAEQGPGGTPDDSVSRAMAVAMYLNKKGITCGRLNISCRGTLPQSQYQQNLLEVCILEQEVKP